MRLNWCFNQPRVLVGFLTKHSLAFSTEIFLCRFETPWTRN